MILNPEVYVEYVTNACNVTQISCNIDDLVFTRLYDALHRLHNVSLGFIHFYLKIK
jgi:hypothetical protein